MATIYLALGSNVGDSRANIDRAVSLLGNNVAGITRGPLYRSRAVGYTNQADFLNTVIGGTTKLKPDDLLDFVKSVEHQVGRVERFRWGPREIDVDIIFYDHLIQDSALLTLPHPAFQERDFVLRPLQDLDPGLTDPRSGKSVAELLEELEPDAHSILERVD